LTFGHGPLLLIPALMHRLTDTTEGQIVEHCPQAQAIMAEIAARLTRKGAALIIDYGGWHSLGDTFQALRAHAAVDPFATPGEADLTAHVDFEALAQATPPAAHAYATQGAFLTALGIHHRAARLAQGMSGASLQSHRAATHRLTSPEEMGTLFKVLAVHPAGTPPPPGSA
jgi:SAM-dependent MidA family methyltransferase